LPGSSKGMLTLALVVVLMVSAGASGPGGILAGHVDTGMVRQKVVRVATGSLVVTGGPFAVQCGVPCKWYAEEFTLTNTGSVDAVVTVHIPEADYDDVIGLRCVEAGTVSAGSPPQEYVYHPGTGSYIIGSPVGAGTASSEAEAVAEEGGQYGRVWLTGLGVDAGDDSGPPEWVLSKHVEVRMWFDANGDGDYLDAGELRAEGLLYDIACTTFELGVVPAGAGEGAWGSGTSCSVSIMPGVIPLTMGQDCHSPTPAGSESCLAGQPVGVERQVVAVVGVSRMFKIELHLQQAEDPAWFPEVGIDYDADGDVDADDAQKRWWPTNLFQGDMCVFDLVFEVAQP